MENQSNRKMDRSSSSDMTDTSSTATTSPSSRMATLGEVNRQHMSESAGGTAQNLNRGDEEGSSTGSSDKMSELRDSVQHITEELRNRVGRSATDLSDRAKDYYDDASTFIQQNYGKVLTVVGVLAAVGFVGYWIANRDREES